MSAQPLDVFGGGQVTYPDRDNTAAAAATITTTTTTSNPTMDVRKSKRASLDRQTKLAQLQLVSKYYGHSNYSYPRPEGAASHNPYRRPGNTFQEPHYHVEQEASAPEQQQQQQQQQQPSPSTRRRTADRNVERTSVGSEGSTPSLIEDHTDSEVSHDDDYQYHASTSELWDSFWVAQDYIDGQTPPRQASDGSHHNHAPYHQPEAPSQNKTPVKPRGEPSARYPALIPSPHIKRTRRTNPVDSQEPLPTRPAKYAVPVRPLVDLDPSKKENSPPQWPIRPTYNAAANTAEEKRRTIRAVKSSYSLFPKQPILNSSNIGAVNATTLPARPPRSSSYQRPQSPTLQAPKQTNIPARSRAVSRPQPVQLNSDPLPATSSVHAHAEPVQRPHTSHSMAPPLPSTSTSIVPNHASHSPHVSDPTTVTSTLPNFPSSNLTDLAHPRAAPLPPQSREAPRPSHSLAPPSLSHEAAAPTRPSNDYLRPPSPPLTATSSPPRVPASHIASQYRPPRRAPPPPILTAQSQMRPATANAPSPMDVCRTPSAEPPITPTLAHQKSFFDFDSDSESESDSPSRGGISRIMKGRKHKHSRSSEDDKTHAHSSSGVHNSPTEQDHGAGVRSSGDKPRRRARALTLGRKAPDADEDAHGEGKKDRKSDVSGGGNGGGRKSDVFGRMFGRKSQ